VVPNNTQMFVKFISRSLEDGFDADQLSLLNCLSQRESTPILASMMQIWREGQTINIDSVVWYPFSQLVCSVMNEMAHHEETMYVCELIRAEVLEELWECFLCTNTAEKLSWYVLLSYILLKDEEFIKLLVQKIGSVVEDESPLFEHWHQKIVEAMEANR